VRSRAGKHSLGVFVAQRSSQGLIVVARTIVDVWNYCRCGTVPVWRAKRAAVVSCVLSSSVSCRLPRSTVASAGLHGLGNACKFITRGVLSAARRRPLAGRVRTAPCTSFCVRRRARFEFEGVTHLRHPAPRCLGLAREAAVRAETSHARRPCPAGSAAAPRARH
jgi:hypothetical protein